MNRFLVVFVSEGSVQAVEKIAKSQASALSARAELALARGVPEDSYLILKISMDVLQEAQDL